MVFYFENYIQYHLQRYKHLISLSNVCSIEQYHRKLISVSNKEIEAIFTFQNLYKANSVEFRDYADIFHLYIYRIPL